MKKWEYLWINQFRGFSSPITGAKAEPFSPVIDLNELGNEGWELVSITPVASYGSEQWAGVTSGLGWIFKRPKE